MRGLTGLLIGTMFLAQAGQALAELPGDGMPANSRACFSWKAEAGKPVKRLLVELHKEEVNPGDPAVIWARVYAEKQGEAQPGYNYDGCGPDEGGSGGLRCGFACDAGTLRISLAKDGLAISPDNLFLRSCGVDQEAMGGFLLTSEDVNGTATVNPVDDAECRSVMAPLEKIMDEAEGN